MRAIIQSCEMAQLNMKVCILAQQYRGLPICRQSRIILCGFFQTVAQLHPDCPMLGTIFQKGLVVGNSAYPIMPITRGVRSA